MHSHGSLAAQVYSLSKAWKISERDRILHCLPLHHVHGVVNALLLPLYVGGSVIALPRFSVRGVFDALHDHVRSLCSLIVVVRRASLDTWWDPSYSASIRPRLAHMHSHIYVYV